jgi:hypothetical protein
MTDDLQFEDYNPSDTKIETSVNPQFVLELAAAIESPQAVCARYEVSTHEYAKLQGMPYFVALLAESARQLVESGKALEVKKQLYLTHGLQRIHDIIRTETDNEVVLKACDRLIDFERPKGSKAQNQPTTAPTFQLVAQDPSTFDTSSEGARDTSGLPFDEMPEDYEGEME